MSNKHRKNVQGDDFLRALLTEMLPQEIPIMLSNQGFYAFLHGARVLPVSERLRDQLLQGCKSKEFTKPYRYNIKKSIDGSREVVLLHPLAQIALANFYKNYEHSILFNCSRSRMSLRYPSKVASTHYRPNRQENLYKFKNDQASSDLLDPLTRHSPSYFSYGGYDRIYKYFESLEFLETETKYSVLATCDVSRCFHSIYTHTMPWAIKGKTFSKSNIKPYQFGNDFDRAMQASNYNETHGIPVGPEISRIFAEIIFQSIDSRIIEECDKIGLKFGQQVYLRRYVDDYFIFTYSEQDAREVMGIISMCLREYNLHVNAEKTELRRRPFMTKKGALIRVALRDLDKLHSKKHDLD